MSYERNANRYDNIYYDDFHKSFYKMTKGGYRYPVNPLNPTMPIQGSGITDTVKEGVKRVKFALSGRDGPGPGLRGTLKSHGDSPITDLYVCRDPIFKEMEKVASLVSSGKWDQAKKDLDYDTMMHLYTIIKLEDGSIWKLEKDEEVYAKKENSLPSGNNCKKIDLKGKTVTLNDLINKGEKAQGQKKFWEYDATDANCQVFIDTILKANGLLTPELKSFINQNVLKVFESLPKYAQATAKLLPKVKQRLNILLRGVGKKRRKKNKKV
jgi:hypothetical protein